MQVEHSFSGTLLAQYVQLLVCKQLLNLVLNAAHILKELANDFFLQFYLVFNFLENFFIDF